MYQPAEPVNDHEYLLGAVRHLFVQTFGSEWWLKYPVAFIAFLTQDRIADAFGQIWTEHWFQILFFGSLMIADALVGVMSAYSRGEKMDGNGWLVLALKTGIYYFPVCLFIISAHVLNDPTDRALFERFVVGVLVVFMIAEFKSIFRNMGKFDLAGALGRARASFSRNGNGNGNENGK